MQDHTAEVAQVEVSVPRVQEDYICCKLDIRKCTAVLLTAMQRLMSRLRMGPWEGYFLRSGGRTDQNKWSWSNGADVEELGRSEGGGRGCAAWNYRWSESNSEGQKITFTQASWVSPDLVGPPRTPDSWLWLCNWLMIIFSYLQTAYRCWDKPSSSSAVVSPSDQW